MHRHEPVVTKLELEEAIGVENELIERPYGTTKLRPDVYTYDAKRESLGNLAATADLRQERWSERGIVSESETLGWKATQGR